MEGDLPPETLLTRQGQGAVGEDLFGFEFQQGRPWPEGRLWALCWCAHFMLVSFHLFDDHHPPHLLILFYLFI